MHRPLFIVAVWLCAVGVVIGTAGLIAYDHCDVSGSERAQHWLMIVVSGAVVASATFLTLRPARPAVVRLASAVSPALAVVAVLALLSQGVWLGDCAS